MHVSGAFTTKPIAAEQTLPLRSAVLRPGRPVEECVFAGDDDPDTLHVGTFRDGVLAAIGSLYAESRDSITGGRDAWRLRGMATDPKLRRMGAGSAVLEACEHHARAAGATLLWCNARTDAVAFYRAHGWVTLGEEFDIPTVGPHFVMEKPLN